MPAGPTDLDEDLQVFQVFAVPLVKGLQELQALAGGAHVHPLPAAVLGGVLVGVLPWVKLLQQGIGTGQMPEASVPMGTDLRGRELPTPQVPSLF